MLLIGHVTISHNQIINFSYQLFTTYCVNIIMATEYLNKFEIN